MPTLRATLTRLTTRAWPVAALLLGGCQAYMPSSAPLAPSTETLRVAFARPRVVVLARDERVGASLTDTIADVTAVYGRVVALRGDTLRLAVTQLARRGALQYTPAGPEAAIELSAVVGVERWSFSPGRTTVLATILTAAVVASGLFLVAFVSAMKGT